MAKIYLYLTLLLLIGTGCVGSPVYGAYPPPVTTTPTLIPSWTPTPTSTPDDFTPPPSATAPLVPTVIISTPDPVEPTTTPIETPYPVFTATPSPSNTPTATPTPTPILNYVPVIMEEE